MIRLGLREMVGGTHFIGAKLSYLLIFAKTISLFIAWKTGNLDFHIKTILYYILIFLSFSDHNAILMNN